MTVSDEQEWQPEDDEEAVDYLGSPRVKGRTSAERCISYAELGARKATARAYIFDGLRYAREHGWPDNSMQTRREVLEEARSAGDRWMRKPHSEEAKRLQSAQAAYCIVLGFNDDLGEMARLAHDELALAEKAEREEQEEQGNE